MITALKKAKNYHDTSGVVKDNFVIDTPLSGDFNRVIFTGQFIPGGERT
jgi:hypothetical protein